MSDISGTILIENTEYTISIPELGNNATIGGLAPYATITDISGINDVDFTFNMQNDITNDIAFNISYNISQGSSFNISTAEYLSELTEEELNSALGYIGDYDIFFDKDYILNGDTLTYSADHSTDSGNTWTELNITDGNIELTTVSGSNIIRLSVLDLQGNEASIYLKYTAQ